MGSAHARLDPPPGHRGRAHHRRPRGPDLVARRDRQGRRDVRHFPGICHRPVRDPRPRRPDLGLLPASSLGHPPSGLGHRRGVRAFHQQEVRGADNHRLDPPHRPDLCAVPWSSRMSFWDSASPLGTVRGLGSARECGEHWIEERITSIALLVLGVWLVASLLLLPDLTLRTVREWLHATSGAIPMALLVITGFVHGYEGMKVVIDDYVHDEGNRFASRLVMLFAAVGGAAIALFALGRLAFGTAA